MRRSFVWGTRCGHSPEENDRRLIADARLRDNPFQRVMLLVPGSLPRLTVNQAKSRLSPRSRSENRCGIGLQVYSVSLHGRECTLMTKCTYQSWGRYPKLKAQNVIPVRWRDEITDLATIEGLVLPYGLGRSYGDSCLNDGGTLLDMVLLNRFIAFDEESRLLRCEAGVTLANILKLTVPRGWFLPTTPGTKFVTVG